jgi:hypothetical protein
VFDISDTLCRLLEHTKRSGGHMQSVIVFGPAPSLSNFPGVLTMYHLVNSKSDSPFAKASIPFPMVDPD